MKTITPDTSTSAAPQQQHPHPQQQQQMPMQGAIIPQQQHITPVIMEATAHVNLVDDDDEKDPLALDATMHQTLALETPQHQHQPANNSTLASPNKHTHSLRYA